jgi:hypothetical protein
MRQIARVQPATQATYRILETSANPRCPIKSAPGKDDCPGLGSRLADLVALAPTLDGVAASKAEHPFQPGFQPPNPKQGDLGGLFAFCRKNSSCRV